MAPPNTSSVPTKETGSGSGSVLLPSGENIFDVAPELAAELHSFRATVSAHQAWPVSGDRVFKKFHKFADLPQDIRHKIWLTAANGQPRVVTIYRNFSGALRCVTPAPTLLHICSESREAALLVYNPVVINSVQNYTFVNFKTDFVFFDTDSRLLHVFGKDPFYPIFQEKVCNLALHESLLLAHGNDISRFIKLKELALVTVRSDYYSYHVSAPGLGKVNFFTMAAPENYYGSNHPLHQNRAPISSLRTLLSNFIKKNPIPRYSLLDVHRAGAPRSMSEAEKEATRIKRKEERDAVIPFRLDEDLAIRTQYELDHRKVVPGEQGQFDGSMSNDHTTSEMVTTSGNSSNFEGLSKREETHEDESDDDNFGLEVATDIDILSDDFLMY